VFAKQALTQKDPAATSAAKVKAIAEHIAKIQR
ncbi:MAG: hypothetical protein HW373_59, partial [Deltaproteobacteria bacterium]|nr:hypothetical protein [Deltaproteobacteria bacterium]